MSNKNTPTSKKSKTTTPSSTTNSGKGNPTPNTMKRSTPSDCLRRKIMTRTKIPTPNRKSSNDCEFDMEIDNNECLNTAFRKSLTPRFKPKPTALNACYTPSSLYRNIKTTPSNKRMTAETQNHQKSNSIGKSKSTSGGTHFNDILNDEIEISNLTVAVRVRPLNAQECTRTAVRNIVRAHSDSELTVAVGTTADLSAGVTHSFNYDHVFYSCDPHSRSFATQKDVFNGTARPLIDRAFEGNNACLFAYGQTGSGKSYSMMGLENLDDDDVNDAVGLHKNDLNPEAGIIPRFCFELFKRLEAVKEQIQAEIEVSYFEIYNEKIHDLLCVAQAEAMTHSGTGTPSKQQQRKALKVREHPIWGPYVVDLSVHSVDSYDALRNWLAVGNSQRATAATGMNDKSSRSHSIFNIVLNLTDLSSDDDTTTSSDTDSSTVQPLALRQTRRSKISLVDLAGSERIYVSGTNSDRIREGVSINKSLLTLGKVIAALSDAKKDGSSKTFVPYRESVLTWLLRESLGGNSKTVMLATISPANIHADETLATLRYACQARTIVNRVKVNESPHDKKIRELRAEVERLKSLRNEYERQQRLSGTTNPLPRKIIIETSVDESEVEALRQQLAERERELVRAQKSWMERLKESEDLRKSEIRLLRRKGLALEISADQKQACLVNLTADPILSGTLFYILPTGVVSIGRTRTSTYASQPDIVLDGPLVAYNHCVIENENGQLFMTPENNDFETFLNGELVNTRQQMFHGDRLVIGGSHYFRISNPFCTRKSKDKLVDFDLAHREILQKQEDKLRRELEEEKRAALSRIEFERDENERNFQERLQELELQQFKYQCNSEILETERRALEEESATKRSELTDALTYTPSFKSTLLEDINRIMQNPSEDSLHKTQLMVKEATQHCRNVGLNYEFRQSKVLDEFGMFRTVVLILDKANGQKAEWPTARLGVWLEIVRDCDNLNAENIFNSVDVEWESIESDLNESLNDSLNSSRISLNLSIVKDALLKPPLQKLPTFLTTNSNSSSANSATDSEGRKIKTKRQQQLTKTALLNACGASATVNSLHVKPTKSTKKMLTYDDDDDGVEQDIADTSSNSLKESSTPTVCEMLDFHKLANQQVRKIQCSILRLKRLCDQSANERENQPNQNNAEPVVREALLRLESILHGLRNYLEQEIVPNTEGYTSPTKTSKSVRFLID